MIGSHILPELKMGMASLFAHKLRSLLTMLGMIFGVGAVVAMLSITAGAQKEMMAFIDQLGVNNIIIEAREAIDRNELQTVRERGYAIDNQEMEEGLKCIAAPVRDHTGTAVASLGIFSPAFRLPDRKISQSARLIMKEANDLSAELGYRVELAIARRRA